ncbi:MAG: hypothetical protein WC380_03255 [Pedobacter sp.]|jgi:Skp family chaperone for outer membrane proteins
MKKMKIRTMLIVIVLISVFLTACATKQIPPQPVTQSELDTLLQEAIQEEKTADELEVEVAKLQKEVDAKQTDLDKLKTYEVKLKAE